MTDFTLETDKELISILNKIFAFSGGVVKNITGEQKNALYSILAKQSKGNVPPPPPPPLPFSGTQFLFNGFNKPMGDALTSQLGNLKKTTENEKTAETKKLPNAVKRNEGQDLLTQELEKAIKRKASKAEEKANKKVKVNAVSHEMRDPLILPIKDRFKLWK